MPPILEAVDTESVLTISTGGIPFWKAIHRNNLPYLIFAILVACITGMPPVLIVNTDSVSTASRIGGMILLTDFF